MAFPKLDDLDNMLVSQYIRVLENPDSIGYKNGRWYQSSRKGDDPNNRGMGVDIKYNKQAQELTKGREGKWLTEEEERKLRNDHTAYSQRVLNKYHPKVSNNPISEVKQAIATGMLYRGDGIKSIMSNPQMKKAYLEGTDEEFANRVSQFYRNKGYRRRANLHDAFIADYMAKQREQEANNNPYGYQYTPVLQKVAEAQGKPWNDLSMKERSEVIGQGVKKGLNNMKDIKAYYEYAVGGNLYKGEDGMPVTLIHL